MYAGVDVIDLKDPSVGALGALDVEVVRQIAHEIDGHALVTATVGEGHATIEALKADIVLYAGLGIDVVKVAVSPLFQQTQVLTELKDLTAQGIKLVAVFFADQPLDFSLIVRLQLSGFYGAMLDTQDKHSSLLAMQPAAVLEQFVRSCKQHDLIVGLAGSVNAQHLDALLALAPTFIGMRGGVCSQQKRASSLDVARVENVKKVLLNYNSVLT